jgi:probable HAF family extracellular repeat protein
MKSLFIAGVSLIASLAAAQSTYSVQDLGPVGGGLGSPYFMSNNGLVAGAATTATNQSHATVWFLGFKLDLASSGLGGPNSFASAVNDLGQVVGSAQNKTVNTEDFCGFNAFGSPASSNACSPFLFQNGVMKQLSTLGGPNGTANWINNRGEAVGWAETIAHDPSSTCLTMQFLPVLWQKTGVRQLPVFPGDTDGVAASINDNGQIVGATGNCAPFDPNSRLGLLEKHAMLWEGGAAISLGNLGGTGTNGGHHACAINNHGVAVGHSDLPGDTTFHTFAWTWETGMQDLGTVAGDFASTAISVNDSGVIVGTSLDSNFNPRAFVWQGGPMTDLNAVLSSNPQKLYLLVSYAVNASGEIAGLAATSDGTLHGFLAVPDSTATSLPAIERTASPAALSEDARKTVFRMIGVRAR